VATSGSRDGRRGGALRRPQLGDAGHGDADTRPKRLSHLLAVLLVTIHSDGKAAEREIKGGGGALGFGGARSWSSTRVPRKEASSGSGGL
jgi:hypothetical protein